MHTRMHFSDALPETRRDTDMTIGLQAYLQGYLHEKTAVYLGKTAKAPVKTPEEQPEIDAEEAARLAAIRKKEMKTQLLILGGWATGMGILTLMRVLRHRKFNAQYKVTPGPAEGFNRGYDEWIRSPNARGFRPDSPQEDDAFFMREMEDWSENVTPNAPHYRQEQKQRMQLIQEGVQRQLKLDRSRKQPSPVDRNSVRGRLTRIDTPHPSSRKGYKIQDFTESPLS